MSATKAINAAFTKAASSRSPLGAGYTGAEIREGIKAARSDDGKIDEREKNLLAHNLMYRGNGADASGSRELKKAFDTLGLPKNPVADRAWVKLNGILTASPKPVPTGPWVANFSSPAKTLETLKRAALEGDLATFKKAFDTGPAESGNLVKTWATQKEMQRIAKDLRAGKPWQLAALGKKYDGGAAVIDYLVTGRSPDPILQVTFERQANGQWLLGFVSDTAPKTPFGR